MNHDKLDNLLKQWASRDGLDQAHAQRLTSRIAEELARRGEPAVEPDGKRWGFGRVRRRLVYAAIVAAAAVLLIVVTPSFLSRWRPAENNEEAAVSPVAPLGRSEIEAGARLFCEVEELFGDQLRWVAENQSEVRLDVRRISSGAAAEEVPLLIRVVVVKKGREEAPWTKVLETNVLTRSEELVELPPDAKMAGRFALWGYPLPDGKIALDASIRLSAPIRAEIDVTNILEPGKPKRVFSFKAENAEYRVYEMAIPLSHYKDVSCSKT
jgi:hypothetical protein